MNSNFGFSHNAFSTNQPFVSGYADGHPQRLHQLPSINTARAAQPASPTMDMQTPGTAHDMNYTPLLPSNLLIGSPFMPQSPSFGSSGFQTFASFPQQQNQQRQQNQAQQYAQSMPGMQGMQAMQNLQGVQGMQAFQGMQGLTGLQGLQGMQGLQTMGMQVQQQAMSPQLYQSLVSPTLTNPASYYPGPQSPTGPFNAMGAQGLGIGNGLDAAPLGLAPGIMSTSSRTVYLGNIPPETSAEELLGHVRSGQIESVRLLPDKNCAFISFLDGSSATHFHSDAILKKLCIKGQDIKIGWGKPSSVPTSVALAVQQSGASRNVYLGNIPEDTTEDQLREELSKFGPIDTVKIVREKAIAFVHFLSIGNSIKAVTQLPQEPKWQVPRRVYYGKDRCAYVSKTQQQNAAQYLGIAPGFAHVLNTADRDLISNALAQQSVAAAAVATSAGGVNNLGNRTVYLGNIHPETTIEEICNVVRGGLLHHVRYIPDKHICFVTFVDPTSAASFFALSNLQGLMIHNRRLKIGWGKHSGALPPAIALAVSGGASRNVYVGNLDETWTEERLRQDFADYGEIELVNTLREKSCAFVNFTNIANAIKAIEAVRGREEYKRFKVNFGKDRCGNPPRQVTNAGQNQNQHQENNSPSSANATQPNRGQNISPASGSSGNNNAAFNPMQGPTASTILNAGNNNPLTMYLAAAQSQQQQQQQQSQQQQQTADLSPPTFSITPQHTAQPPHLTTQQAFYSGDSATSLSRAAGLGAPSQHQHYGHHATHSMNVPAGAGLNGSGLMSGVGGIGGSSGLGGAPIGSSANGPMRQSLAKSQHSRTLSLPVFSQGPSSAAQLVSGLGGKGQAFAGLGAGLGGAGFGGGESFGLAIQTDGGLAGWAEEEGGL